jgi:hypothetical protein
MPGAGYRLRPPNPLIDLRRAVPTFGDSAGAPSRGLYKQRPPKELKTRRFLGLRQRLARQPPKRSTPLQGRQDKPPERTRFLWEF